MSIKSQKKIILIPVLSLDTSRPGSLIDPRGTPDCQNVRIERTQIKKKEGYSPLSSARTGNVMLLGEINREGTDYFFCLTTSKFYWWNGGSASWVDYTNGTLNGTVVNPCSHTTAKISGKNILVFSNYVDVIQKWIGSGNNIAALGGSPPLAKFLLGFNRFLLLAYIKDGANLYPERVQWSDYDDPEQWTEATDNNAGSDELDDGSPITGMFRLGNVVVVPKVDSIWVGYLTGDDRVWQFDSVERRLGFMVGATIQVIPGGLALGLSRNGIVQFNGLRSQLVMPGIFEDLRDFTNPDLVHKSFSAVVAELNEYWLFIPLRGQTYPTRLYRYNYVTGQVYKDLVTNLTAAGLWTNIGKTLIDSLTGTINSYTGIFDEVLSESFYPILSLGDKDGKVFKFDYNEKDENGTAISAYWCSADIVEYPGFFSHYTELFYEGLGNMPVISYSTDEGANFTVLNDSYQLLLHCNGEDGGTTFTDSSGRGHVVTAVGTAQLDTAQKVFGTASLLLDGNSDALSIPHSNNWNFGVGDFTIEFRVRLSVDQLCVFMSQKASALNYWNIQYSVASSELSFFYRYGGATKAYYLVAWNPAINTDYHIEISRRGNTINFFIDGAKQTLTEVVAIGSNDLEDIVAPLIIGYRGDFYYVAGWMDEIAITKGIARHTKSFTIPTAEYLAATTNIATTFIPCDILAEKLRIKVANDILGETFTMRNLYYKPPIRREAIER